MKQWKKPMLAAALTAGLFLIGVPLWGQNAHAAAGQTHGMGEGHGMADSHGMHMGGHGGMAPQGHPLFGGHRMTVSEQLQRNTHLSTGLAKLLPAGTNLQTASAGFKNLGQFVAAVHVAHNLGIPFDELKDTMIGPPKKNLGQAIHQLRPAANSKAQVQDAQRQAKQDLKRSH